MEQEEKVKENKIRRKLARMGYGLTKNRVRDPQAYNYNGYMILDAWTNSVVTGAHPYQYAMSFEDVEEFARKEGPNRPKGKRRAKKGG